MSEGDRSVVLHDVEVAGHDRVDVRLQGGRVVELGRRLDGPRLLDGGGGALLPGLHDHHVHLLAMAAARRSVAVGPREIGGRAGLAAALAGAPVGPGGWVRAVGYHEDVAGELDRHVLDELAPGRRVRVQHRSGQLWVLSSAALDAVLVAHDGPLPASVERDGTGRPTGRLVRADDWLRARLDEPPPDLAPVGAELAACGVTGVTDATPVVDLAAATPVLDAAGRELPQRLVLMSGADPAPFAELIAAGRSRVTLGPVKVVLDEARLPALDDLVARVAAAHQAGRAVAVHCVTLAELALAGVALELAGPSGRDRIEHGGVVPAGWAARLAELEVTVVTQPSFVRERGDGYLRHVDADDVGHLYPCGSLLAAGVRVAGSTDAPYASADPWAAMRAAVDRTTAAGAPLGRHEATTPARALELFLGRPDDPGGPARRVVVGEVADLCLLAVPLAVALDDLDAGHVAATFVGGQQVAPVSSPRAG